MSIKEKTEALLKEIPQGVIVEAAAKTRTAEEILQAIEGGITVIGQNYIRDLKAVYDKIGARVKWHFIGSVRNQKNELFRAKYLKIIDMIETIDNLDDAEKLNKRCKTISKVMPVLIEINSAEEPQKSGVMPDDAIELIKSISSLDYIRIEGLMTMGKATETPEDARIYFRLTRQIFEEVKRLGIDNVNMKYLSMGMTDTYKIAIEEGANIVRIGTAIFGPRKA
ncbi:YggS family pyridoxal phosphate-dependent enzyme [Hippea sp. KM1]|uniref:YggS family pyridoxal phosphate-dependent enzyme n=1 Tax=Hippea sp. KM1 TaxID=944481 RepID=UPI00046D9429|nr:YggS family pyridoxal phosphate-dependent enzyme [Hippea sp. KM1]